MNALTKIHQLFFILLFLFLQTPTFAQDSARKARVKYIKDLHTYYQSRIRRGKYYLNEYKINSGALPWQNKSNLQKTEKYYYSYTDDAEPILRYCSIVIEANHKKLYKIFLFDQKKQMILCIVKQEGEGNKYAYSKLTAYFTKEGELAQLLHDKTDIPYRSLDENPRLVELKKESDDLLKKFQAQFLKAGAKD